MKWLLPCLLLVSCGQSPRDLAAMRGLRFLEQVAENPEHFKQHGDDLMWAFYTIAEAASDKQLQQASRVIGVRLAQRWRAVHQKLPADAGVNKIYKYASASCTADRLGIVDEGIRQDLAGAARRFKAEDFLSFDPSVETVPADVPESCKRCDSRNKRGVKVCRKCGERLEMANPYDILFDALITTYTGKLCGIWMGGEFDDVVRSIPKLRPYPAHNDYAVTYTITHIIYTLNDYSRYRLRAEWLPQEFQFLKTHAQKAIDENDVETLGEFLDSLQSLGMTEKDPLLRRGIDHLLAHQNADGSWGDVNDKSIYTRYHTTWTGIGGVMAYDWHGEGTTSTEAIRRLRE